LLLDVFDALELLLLLSSLSLLELLPLLLLEEDEVDECRRLLLDLRDVLLALCSALSAALSMVATDSGICSRLVAGFGTGFSFWELVLPSELSGATAAAATTCWT